MHVKALGILLLLAGIITGLWKLYDAGGDAREDRIVREWQEERLALTAKVEPQIQKDRIVYRDRIHKIREVVVECDLPTDLISLLRESGVFSGPVRDTVNP